MTYLRMLLERVGMLPIAFVIMVFFAIPVDSAEKPAATQGPARYYVFEDELPNCLQNEPKQCLIEECKAYLFGINMQADNQKAIQCFERNGSTIARGFIALAHFRDNREKNRARGIDLFNAVKTKIEVACNNGDADACFLRGMYSFGVLGDKKASIELLEKSAKLGSAVGDVFLCLVDADFIGEKQNYTKAMECDLKAANIGIVAAMTEIGDFYKESRGVRQDYARAMEWYLKAADKGDVDAMRNIGILYNNGQGVKQDYTKALEWYLKAANKGNTYSMARIAELYEYGRGVNRDYPKAMTWYLKAANNGDTFSMMNIAYFYADGQGVKKNQQKAMQWYRKAADNGDVDAMYVIGIWYSKGKGVKQDYKQAMKWYRKAADKGDKDAMNQIADLYENGWGVPVDEDKAEEWHAKASAKATSTVDLSGVDFSGVLPSAEASQQSKTPPFLLISDVKFYEPSGNKILDAFESGKISLVARNDGKGPAKDVKLQVAFSDKAHAISGLTFNETTNLGTMQPGEERKIEVDITAQENVPTASVELKAVLVEGNGLDSSPTILAFSTGKLIPPRFEVTRIEIEDPDGKRVLGKGKQTRINLIVQNAGAGEARNVEARMDIDNEDIKLYSEGMVKLGTINPGETKRAAFDIVVSNRYKGDKTLPVKFTVKESTDRFTIKPDIALRLGEEAPDIMVVRVKPQDTLKSSAEKADDISIIPALDKLQMAFGQNDLAVVIGIEKYQNISNSEFSYNDAKLVRGYLKALGFADRNIEFITDERATRSGIEKSVENWLPNRVKKGSRVFIYYSGHGSPDPTTGEPYIVPHDADLNYLTTTGYPLKRLYAQLAKLEAKDVIVALDSCFSGAGGKGVLPKGAKPALPVIEDPLLAAQNIAVIASSEGIQISTSIPDKGYSLFTYYFLKAIKDGKGDLVDIYQYIKPLVEDEARGINVAQSPSLRPGAETLKGRFALRK